MPRFIQNIVGDCNQGIDCAISINCVKGKINTEDFIHVGNFVAITQDLSKAVSVKELYNDNQDVYRYPDNNIHPIQTTFGLKN